MQKKKFISNVLTMTASMLAIRIMGMGTNIYISSLLGAGAVGLYQMIFSVFSFGITFASSGTGFAATRLIAEGRGDERLTVQKCLVISSVMSGLGFLFFFFGASFVGHTLIRNDDAIEAVRILSFCLPCMGTSSVLRGYYIGKRRAGLMTLSSILEEVVSIATTLALIRFSPIKGHLCLVIGLTTSNIFAFVFDITAYNISISAAQRQTKNVSFKDIFSICVPVSLGSYMRSLLVTIENLGVPMQLEIFGTVDPVGEYGLIKGMAMPLVLFPTIFIQAFSSMLVPEMSELRAKGRPNGIRHVSMLSLNTTTFFAFFISLMLFNHYDIIGRTFYKEPKISYYIGMLSLLAIPMYLDTVADSILKGLDLQNASLKYNIIDSLLRLLWVFLVLPRFGAKSYIAMIYISEIFNLTLSLKKAAKHTGLSIDYSRLILLPLFASVISSFFTSPVIQTSVYLGIYFGISSCVSIRTRLKQEK